MFDGKIGKYIYGIGHTHPPGYGPIFSNSNLQNSKFGDDFYASSFYRGLPNASSLHIVGSPDMKLISAIEAKKDGVIAFHPIDVLEKNKEISNNKKGLKKD
jgi:hypothetical protein